MEREDVFLGLGSNLGDREDNLARAIHALGQRGFEVTRRSSLYATEPVGGPPQGWFLNAAVGGRTRLEPEELLAGCLELERALGRVRTMPDAPRTVDIDLLLYGDVVRDQPSLKLPHPRMHERRFVLVPLAEIAPAVRHPVLGLTVAELLARCPDRSQVLPHAPASRR